MKNTSKLILAALSLTLIMATSFAIVSCGSKPTESASDVTPKDSAAQVIQADTIAQTPADSTVNK